MPQFRSHFSQATVLLTGLPNIAWLWPMSQRDIGPCCAMAGLAFFSTEDELPEIGRTTGMGAAVMIAALQSEKSPGESHV
jgi:hypothetical protein